MNATQAYERFACLFLIQVFWKLLLATRVATIAVKFNLLMHVCYSTLLFKVIDKCELIKIGYTNH